MIQKFQLRKKESSTIHRWNFQISENARAFETIVSCSADDYYFQAGLFFRIFKTVQIIFFSQKKNEKLLNFKAHFKKSDGISKTRKINIAFPAYSISYVVAYRETRNEFAKRKCSDSRLAQLTHLQNLSRPPVTDNMIFKR